MERRTTTPTLRAAYTYAKARAIGSREALKRAAASAPIRMAALSHESQARKRMNGVVGRGEWDTLRSLENQTFPSTLMAVETLRGTRTFGGRDWIEL